MNADYSDNSHKKSLEYGCVKLEWQNGGIFNKIYPRKKVDLELSTIALSEDNDVLEIIARSNPMSQDESIIHNTHNSHSATKKNNEIINIDFTQVASEINTLMIAVCSFNALNIAEAHKISLYISGNNSNENISIALKDFDNTNGIIIGGFRRTQDDRKWKFVSVGARVNEPTMNELTSTAIAYSREISDTII